MKSLVKKIAIFSIIIGFVFLFSQSVLIADAAEDKYGLDATADGAGLKTTALGGETTPAQIIGTVLGILLSFVGVLFLMLMIYGGVIWMIARGNEAEVKKAKDIIISAIYGIVIVAASYAVTKFIFSNLVGS